jgi:hypothetical protein
MMALMAVARRKVYIAGEIVCEETICFEPVSWNFPKAPGAMAI